MREINTFAGLKENNTRFHLAGGAVDSLESFDLDIKIPHNFVLHDKVRGNDENKWKFRLPWPLFDMTTVKIPVR